MLKGLREQFAKGLCPILQRESLSIGRFDLTLATPLQGHERSVGQPARDRSHAARVRNPDTGGAGQDRRSPARQADDGQTGRAGLGDDRPRFFMQTGKQQDIRVRHLRKDSILREPAEPSHALPDPEAAGGRRGPR